jgi:surfeit locus 1 family protein
MPLQETTMRVTKKWWFLMVAIPIIGLCVQAVFWQLGRAEEKTALLAQLELGEGVVSNRSELRALDPSQSAYRVSLPVVRTEDPLMLLDNRVYERVVGYEVFGWVRPADGTERLLVNFGWVAGGSSRAELPVVELPETYDLQGRWVGLTESYLMGQASAERFNGLMRVQSLDGIAGQADIPGVFLAEGMLSQDARGPEPRLGPTTHYGYAVQWGLLALVLTGLTGWMFRRGFAA